MVENKEQLLDYKNNARMKTIKYRALIKGNKSPVDIKVELSKNAFEEIYYKLKSELSDTFDLEEITGLATKYYGKNLKDFEPREWFNILDKLISFYDEHKFNYLIEIDGTEYPVTKLNSKTNEIEYQDGEGDYKWESLQR